MRPAEYAQTPAKIAHPPARIAHIPARAARPLAKLACDQAGDILADLTQGSAKDCR